MLRGSDGAAPLKVTQRENPGAAWLGHALAGLCTNENRQGCGICVLQS